MVWFCKFWGSINGWNLRILYKDYESWKNDWKKLNGMSGIEYRLEKLKKIK